MLFLLLFVATVITICMLTVWCLPDLPRRGAGPRTEDTGKTAPAAEPESLEGVLVAKLLAHEINPAQYRRAIEGLAARDEDRHPLAVPPEIGSADA